MFTIQLNERLNLSYRVVSLGDLFSLFLFKCGHQFVTSLIIHRCDMSCLEHLPLSLNHTL